MNNFTTILFNFIFMFTLLFFKIPDIENDNYIQHKLIIFISLFSFNYILRIISSVRAGCPVDQYEIGSKSLRDATAAVIGYSIYIDFKIMEWSKGYFSSLETSRNTLYLIATLNIILFVTLIKIIVLLFDSTNKDCANIE